MSYKEILKRADKERKLSDGVVWEGICTRCGLIRKAFADEIEQERGDPRTDVRDLELVCKSPRCLGRIRWFGKLSAERAIHLNDIRRRK